MGIAILSVDVLGEVLASCVRRSSGGHREHQLRIVLGREASYGLEPVRLPHVSGMRASMQQGCQITWIPAFEVASGALRALQDGTSLFAGAGASTVATQSLLSIIGRGASAVAAHQGPGGRTSLKSARDIPEGACSINIGTCRQTTDRQGQLAIRALWASGHLCARGDGVEALDRLLPFSLDERYLSRNLVLGD